MYIYHKHGNRNQNMKDVGFFKVIRFSQWLIIGIVVGSFLVALGLGVLLKFLPIRGRLIVFLVILLGGLLGGIFGSGHNIAAMIATIRAWGSG